LKSAKRYTKQSDNAMGSAWKLTNYAETQTIQSFPALRENAHQHSLQNNGDIFGQIYNFPINTQKKQAKYPTLQKAA